jgi:hypothetical protein
MFLAMDTDFLLSAMDNDNVCDVESVYFIVSQCLSNNVTQRAADLQVTK